jgi:hypothetical protein
VESRIREKFEHPAMQYERIFLMLRPNGVFFHCNVFKNALNLHIPLFCKDVIDGVDEWFAANKADPCVQKNLAHLAQFHPNGLLRIFPAYQPWAELFLPRLF